MQTDTSEDDKSFPRAGERCVNEYMYMYDGPLRLGLNVHFFNPVFLFICISCIRLYCCEIYVYIHIRGSVDSLYMDDTDAPIA